MKIIVDGFGGDNAPKSVLEGVSLAKTRVSATLAITGDVEKLKACAAGCGINLDGIELIPAPSVVTMHDDPKAVLKQKADSSMSVGLRAVADGEADAFVSAGSTGALLMGGTFIVRRAKGIKRPAIASVVPKLEGVFMLLDCGANNEARPEVLVQFAKMGTVYMNKICGLAAPRVGLINNGTEETKGTDVLRETHALLKECADINFIGNVEARELPADACDVAVADGFCGNLVLKTMEGLASAMFKKLKGVFYKNFATKLAAGVLKPSLKELKKSLDSSEYGGAPLLGLAKPVIKAHGSSDAKAIMNAVRQAEACVAGDVCGEISAFARGEDDE